jgi:hypothetical protein
MFNIERIEERGARWANIIAAFPGCYCAFVLWGQRHPGGGPLSQYPGFTFAVITFFACITIGAVLNLLRRREPRPKDEWAGKPPGDVIVPHWVGYRSEEDWKQAIIQHGRKDLEVAHKDELRRLEVQHNAELENSREAYRQCMLERGAAMHGAEECMEKLALFSPPQIEAFRLARDLRKYVEECGEYPKKEAYGYNGDAAPSGSDGLNLIHDYHAARRELDNKIMFGYQLRFKGLVRDFVLRIGEAGYPVMNPDWDMQIRDRDGYLKLAATLEEVALWFGRNPHSEIAKGVK